MIEQKIGGVNTLNTTNTLSSVLAEALAEAETNPNITSKPQEVFSSALTESVTKSNLAPKLVTIPQFKVPTGFPQIVNLQQRVELNLSLPDVLVKDLLHRGSKMLLSGGSKSRKSWMLIDLALSVANGVPFLGRNTTQGRVLYVNFELQEEFFNKRADEISTAKGMGFEALGNVDCLHLRGHCTDLAILKAYILDALKTEYSLIILDPIYKVMGGRDENSVGAIGELLNEIEVIAVKSKAAVVFGHHFSKGNQAGKESIDRASGSGAFARDPDTIITITPHENEDTYTVEANLRNFAPLAPFCIKWIYPLMQVDEESNPDKLKVAGNKKEQYKKEDLLEILGEQELSCSKWYMAASHKLGISQSAFLAKIKLMVGDTVTKTDGDKYKATAVAKNTTTVSAEKQVSP